MLEDNKYYWDKEKVETHKRIGKPEETQEWGHLALSNKMTRKEHSRQKEKWKQRLEHGKWRMYYRSSEVASVAEPREQTEDQKEAGHRGQGLGEG